MQNPVNQIIAKNQPFVYFHTFFFNRNILDLAKSGGKSFEVDISMDKAGNLFAGHPHEFYEFKKMDPPNNLPLEQIIQEVEKAGLYLVLDCKDVRALLAVEQIIKSYGAERTLLHSWITEFEFKPYEPSITVEPHWEYEDLPLAEVMKLKQATGVPIISSMRGLTQARLRNEPEIVETVIKSASGRIDAVNFNLPGNNAPPISVMQQLLDNGILTWLNVDYVAADHLPPVYIGISDYLHSVTDPRTFGLGLAENQAVNPLSAVSA